MRKFLFSLLLISVKAYSQIDPGNGSDGFCDHVKIVTNSPVYNCTTLRLDSSPNFDYALNTNPIIIKVQGDVIINAPLSLDGENGSYSGSANGGRGGPGADAGGAYSLGSNDADNTPSGGFKGVDSGTCGGGGGGGSFFNLGTNGIACPTGGLGGNAGTINYDPYVSIFRGGFGGGSGGEGPPASAGSGGGGGGAIRIMAGGNVFINANISVKGGSGGIALNPNAGGGGGGGSGGVIWIQTLAQMNNNGIFDISGGSGGAAYLGGQGGNGGSGTFLLEDSDGIITGSGSGAGGSRKFNSDISCGSVMRKNENVPSQMFASFSMMLILGWMIRRTKNLKIFS